MKTDTKVANAIAVWAIMKKPKKTSSSKRYCGHTKYSNKPPCGKSFLFPVRMRASIAWWYKLPTIPTRKTSTPGHIKSAFGDVNPLACICAYKRFVTIVTYIVDNAIPCDASIEPEYGSRKSTCRNFSVKKEKRTKRKSNLCSCWVGDQP